MNKKFPLIVLTLIAVVSFFVMLSVSIQESAIMDEQAHIPAGYSYLRYLDYRLNPEHPPLVKVLAAVPLMFMGLNFPTKDSDWVTYNHNKNLWTNGINEQWAAGNLFLYWSANNADGIIFWARLGPILLTILLTLLIYLWARELLGEWWGLLPAFLFAFSPSVLAHGHYVTTDIGAGFGIVLGTYFFIKYLLKPTGKNLIFAGLTLGIAQLAKFSAVLLIPYFFVLFLIWYFRDKKDFWRRFLAFIAIFVIAYALVFLVYAVLTLNYPVAKQVSDTKLILTSFKHRLFADIDIWMAGNKFLRPLAHYLLGVLMVSQRSVNGNTAYFLGQVSASGWWYYFPVVFLLKEPVPSLILIFIALGFCLCNFFRSLRNSPPLKAISYKLKAMGDYLGTHFAEFSMLLFVVFYWLYSMQGKLNIGIRHILPTMPFIYILVAAGLKNWVNSGFWKKPYKIAVVSVFVFWYFLEMAGAYPYYLSYFNQLGGGTANGYINVTDSNYDWGQDLKRLADFVKQKNISKIAVDYFGGGDVNYYLGDKVGHCYSDEDLAHQYPQGWQSKCGNPTEKGIEWMAVSVNTLESALAKTAPGFVRNPDDEYRCLQQIKNPLKPDFKAGTSIFIYHL